MQIDKFEKTVLIIAVVVLIVTLTIVGILLKNTTDYKALPAPSCPDFWYNSYTFPCQYTTNGCCTDGVTPKTDASGSNCGINCSSTTFGCCPDGYSSKVDASGTNCPASTALCFNVHHLGDQSNPSCQTQDFSIAPFVGSNGLCQKQKWSQTCDVTWDGVTNINSAC